MSKFTVEKRDQMLKELMVSVRKNTQGSKCIDVFEILLNEIPDKNVVDTVLVDMHSFITEFFRLCHDVDKMENIDFIARILTREFINPSRFFKESKKLAEMYLMMDDILYDMYPNPIYENEKKILLPNVNVLGDITHKEKYTASDVVKIATRFGNLSDLTVSEVRDKHELARKAVLLYNYLPAVVKAFIQTKRRSFDLDRNSKKFYKEI